MQHLFDFLPQIESGINLCCVKLLAHFADFRNESGSHAHVDIFVLNGEVAVAFCDPPADGFQPRDDLILFLHGDDTLFSQHGHMGNAAIDILIVHSLFESDGCVETLHQIIHFLFKSSAP